MPETEAEIKERLEILRKLRAGEIVLEPCPFCGSLAWYSGVQGKVLMIRSNCDKADCPGAQILLVGEDNKGWLSIIERWNRRAGR